MKELSRIGLLIALLISAQVVLAQFDDWTLEKEVNDIRLYSRDSTGSDRIKLFGASLYLNADLNAALKMLQDVPNYNLWLNGVDTSFVERSISPEDFQYHVFISKNFLFYRLRRDAVAQLKMSCPDATTCISNSFLIQDAPLEEDYQRLMHYRVGWEFRLVEDNRVLVTYQSVADVQFPFAYFFLKSFILESLEVSFKKMQQEIQRY